MVTKINVNLPEELVSQARQFVRDGWVADFDGLLAEALRRYLDSHAPALAEKFIREDIAFGLEETEQPTISVHEFRAILDKGTFCAESLPIDFDRDDIYSDHD